MNLINVHNHTGQYALGKEQGQELYDRVHPELLNQNLVELDFSEVRLFGSAFFNYAIGQLLRDIPPDDLNRLLLISGLNESGDRLLRIVIANAKQFYQVETK